MGDCVNDRSRYSMSGPRLPPDSPQDEDVATDLATVDRRRTSSAQSPHHYSSSPGGLSPWRPDEPAAAATNLCRAGLPQSAQNISPQSPSADTSDVRATTEDLNSSPLCVKNVCRQSPECQRSPAVATTGAEATAEDLAKAGVTTTTTTNDDTWRSSRCCSSTEDYCYTTTTSTSRPESVQNVCRQSPRSTSADTTDVRATTEDVTSYVAEVWDNPDDRSSSPSSSALSPNCLNEASPTDITTESFNNSCSVLTERTYTSGAKPDVVRPSRPPRASWMAVDKTLLCDVVDQMLCDDVMFSFPQRRDAAAFPYPVDDHYTGSGPESWLLTAASTQRRLLDADVMLHALFNDSRPEPEMPRQSVMTSSLRWHQRIGSSNRGGCRLNKRSTHHATSDSAAKRRRCRESAPRNLLPFPVYVNTTNNEMKCSDDDDCETRGNMAAHSPPTLRKWKSTMLLRMRSETETPEPEVVFR